MASVDLKHERDAGVDGLIPQAGCLICIGPADKQTARPTVSFITHHLRADQTVMISQPINQRHVQRIARGRLAFTVEIEDDRRSDR
jgi:hypothetical protein